MRATLIAALVAVLALAPAAMAQSYLLGTNAGQNTTTTYPSPYGNWYSGQRAQYIYQAGELSAAGLTAGPINFIGWDVIAPGGAACQGFEIKMGLTTTVDLSAGWDTPAVVPLTTVFGPTSYQDTAGWNFHNVGGFLWDGTSNILVEICFWNGVSTYTTNAVVYNSPTPFVSALTYRSDSAPSCGSANLPNFSDNIRPDTAFGDGTPPIPQFQPNSGAASLDINGAQGSSFAPAATVAVLNAPLSLNLDSSNVGMGFEIFADAPGPLIPTSAGALVTMGGQVININLSSPGWIPLFNFALPPFPGTTSLSFSIPVALSASAQMLIIDPGMVDGFSVSAGADLNVINALIFEDFETAVTGNPGTYPTGWTDGGGNYPWRVNSGGTSSSPTGPTGDHTTGSGNYMYCETSSPVAVGQTFILNLPPFNAPPTPASASFWVNMYGSSTGTLNLEEFDGTTWNVRWTLSGDQGTAWLNQIAPLMTPTGGQYVLRFHYTAAADPGGTVYWGDTAIDDVVIQ